jgi:hypothetical protein
MNLIRSWRPFVTRNVRERKLFPIGVLFNNIYSKKPQNTMKFKRRPGEFKQECVLSESYTADDALPPILPACCQLACLLLETLLVTRDFFFPGKFVREPICLWWEAFVEPWYCWQDGASSVAAAVGPMIQPNFTSRGTEWMTGFFIYLFIVCSITGSNTTCLITSTMLNISYTDRYKL